MTTATTLSHTNRGLSTTLSLGAGAAICVAASYAAPPAIYSALWTLWLTALAATLYRHTAGYSRPGLIALAIAGTVLAIGIGVNLYTYTTLLGGTDSNPILLNNDSWRLWQYTTALYGYDTVTWYSPPLLYHYALAAAMCLTGPSVTAALLLSAACTLASLICAATLYVNVTGKRKHAWLAMAALACVAYFLASGTLLLKDSWTILAMTLGGVALTTHSNARMTGLFILAVLMMATARPNMVLALVLGLPIMKIKPRQTPWLRITLMATFAVAVLVMAQLISHSPETQKVMAGGKDLLIATGPYQQAYTNMVGDYFTLPHWQRLLLLPLTTIVQFLIPFPWNWLRDVHYGYSEILAHVSLGWYAFGGTLLYFLFGPMRTAAPPLKRLTLWACAVWLVPCYLMGGIISRYGLMAMPMMAPAVAYTLTTCRHRRSFRIWARVFCAAMAITLCVCYLLQKNAL